MNALPAMWRGEGGGGGSKKWSAVWRLFWWGAFSEGEAKISSGGGGGARRSDGRNFCCCSSAVAVDVVVSRRKLLQPQNMSPFPASLTLSRHQAKRPAPSEGLHILCFVEDTVETVEGLGRSLLNLLAAFSRPRTNHKPAPSRCGSRSGMHICVLFCGVPRKPYRVRMLLIDR